MTLENPPFNNSLKSNSHLIKKKANLPDWIQQPFSSLPNKTGKNHSIKKTIHSSSNRIFILSEIHMFLMKIGLCGAMTVISLLSDCLLNHIIYIVFYNNKKNSC